MATKRKLLPPKLWKRDEILTFLDIFESTFHASVSDPFDSEADMWKCISSKLQDQAITASAEHCQNKWNFLYKTYVNNQNRTGAFYSKIKQIVDFSQRLSDQQEQETIAVEEPSNEIIAEVESEVVVKQEQVCEEEPITEVVETLEEDALVEDSRLQSTDKQEDSSTDSVEEEVPAKVIKLADERDEPDAKEEPSAVEAKPNNDVDIRDILTSIVDKINAIQQEQLTQGKRLAEVEKLQLENNRILSDLKQKLDLK